MKRILFFLLLVGHLAFAQSFPYKNLVFEGAGIRGVAYTGVLSELQSKGIMPAIEKVGGTSAGAIMALTVSLGYTGKEIEKIIYETNFNDFNDGKYFFIGGLYRMKNNYGWYQGGNFETWLDTIILAKTKNPNITFSQLHASGFKDLYVTGTNLSTQKLMVFSRKTFPDMKIKDAVRISMSIPLYFESIFIDSTGKIYNKQNSKNSLQVVVDGGIIGNFPIQIFDTIAFSNGKPIRVCNSHTLGIRIDSEEQIKYDNSTRELAPCEIDDMKSYITAFYNIILENLNRSQLTEEDWKRTISVSSAGIGPKVQKLSKEQKDILISSGHSSAVKFLSK